MYQNVLEFQTVLILWMRIIWISQIAVSATFVTSTDIASLKMEKGVDLIIQFNFNDY